MLSEAMKAALDKLDKLRGPADQWVAKKMQVSRFVAEMHKGVRVFCYGEVRTPDGHWPAVLTYNPVYKQTLAWAPSGRKGTMQSHHEGFFHSDIPHAAIAREVHFGGPETTEATHD